HPTIGEKGKEVEVEEERIEMLCEKKDKEKIKRALIAVHPYEEPAYHFVAVEI
ncbi:MAG: hypothetical protein RIQ56_373, partial [Candidatus Parcubacteria bacterium]